MQARLLILRIHADAPHLNAGGNVVVAKLIANTLGILRLVRDVWTIPGEVQCDARGQVCTISLNQRCPYATILVQAFASLLAADGVVLDLRQIWAAYQRKVVFPTLSTLQQFWHCGQG